MDIDLLRRKNEFVVDSNEVVELKIVRRSSELYSGGQGFNPEMSHQIFGDAERIFGYKDLKIKLYYTPGWINTYFNFKHAGTIDDEAVGIEPDDVEGAIRAFLRHEYCTTLDIFEDLLKREATFKPFGEMKRRFEGEGNKIYEIYHVAGNEAGRRFFSYYDRVQNFVLWFIDAANLIDLDDEKWNYFITYEVYENDNGDTCYGLIGFATVYEYYAYPCNTRPRISQLVILPPYQKQGIAIYLLNAINNHFCCDPMAIDITVEDANGICQAIRDFHDVCRCHKLECFTKENLKNPFNKEIAEILRKRFKIHKKQARRIYEILRLAVTNKNNENEYKEYRLMVKRRLNAPYDKMGKFLKRMKDSQNIPEELSKIHTLCNREIRIEMLSKQYADLEEHYERVIKRFLHKPMEIQ